MSQFNFAFVLFFATLQTIHGQNSIYCVDPHTGLHYPVNSTWPSTTFCGTYSCNVKIVPREENPDKYDSVPTLAENRTREIHKEEEDSYKEATEIQSDLKEYIQDVSKKDIDEEFNTFAKKADIDRLIELYKAVQILIKTIEQTEHDLGVVAQDELTKLEETTIADSSDTNLNNNHIRGGQYYMSPEAINHEAIKTSEVDSDIIPQEESASLGETKTTDTSGTNYNNHNLFGSQQYYMKGEAINHEILEKTESDSDTIAHEDLARLGETTTIENSYSNMNHLNYIREAQQYYLTPEPTNPQTIVKTETDLGAQNESLTQEEITSTDNSDANLIDLSDIRGGHQYFLTPETINRTLEEIYQEYNEFLSKYSTLFPQYTQYSQNPESSQNPEGSQNAEASLGNFEESDMENYGKPTNTLTYDTDISASENYQKFNNFEHSTNEQTGSSKGQEIPDIYSRKFQNYPRYFTHRLSQPKTQIMDENSRGRNNLHQSIPSTLSSPKKEDTQKVLTLHDYLTQIGRLSPNCKDDQKSYEAVKKSSPDESDYNTKIEPSNNSSQENPSNLSVSYYQYDPSQGKYVIKVPKDMEEYEKFLQEYMRVYNLTNFSPHNNPNVTFTRSEPTTEPANKHEFDNCNGESNRRMVTINEKENADNVKATEMAQVYSVPTFEYKYSNPYKNDYEECVHFESPDDVVQMKPNHCSVPTINEKKERKNDIFSKDDDEVDLDSLRSRLLVPRSHGGLVKVPRLPRLSNPLVPSIFRNKRSAKPQYTDKISGESGDKTWKTFITVEGCPETLEPGKFKNGEAEKRYPACCPQKIND